MNERGVRGLPRSVRLAGAVLVLTGIAGMLGGCYKRVVSARGIGADQYAVSERYAENTKVTRWVYGDKRPKSSDSRPRD